MKRVEVRRRMKPFDLDATLESGQLFRWKRVPTGAWICHRDQVFFVTELGVIDAHDDAGKWFLRHDQPALEHEHTYVQEALAALPGLRIVRQDPWECLVTFIVSQNNNTKRIAQNVASLAGAFGSELSQGFFSFPTPEQLGNEEQIRELGLGYRAGHIAKLRDIDIDWLHNLATLPYDTAKEQLMTIDGIGPKVADCILLFSLGFDEACPEDTWIKKVFGQTGLTREDLGNNAGLIQQFLFQHARTN